MKEASYFNAEKHEFIKKLSVSILGNKVFKLNANIIAYIAGITIHELALESEESRKAILSVHKKQPAYHPVIHEIDQKILKEIAELSDQDQDLRNFMIK